MFDNANCNHPEHRPESVNGKRPTVFMEKTFAPFGRFEHGGVVIYASHVCLDVSAYMYRNRMDDIDGCLNFLNDMGDEVANIPIDEHIKIIHDIFGIKLLDALYEDSCQ